MYTLQVKRLPVVDAGGYLVGIVSRADLLTVFDRSDEEIHSEIVNDVILRDFLIDPAVYTVAVADGVVTIKGNPETADLAPQPGGQDPVRPGRRGGRRRARLPAARAIGRGPVLLTRNSPRGRLA